MNISARGLDFREVNRRIRQAGGDVRVDSCCGQRYLGCGMGSGRLTIYGTPGNALGAYLNGGEIHVHGNAQDAVGDTMNEGKIVIHGNAGDALGYAMRGGCIYVRGDAGYRAGIHMKEYMGKRPAIVIGGRAGSFLGEYLAGGILIVLGLGGGEAALGAFAGVGMHGGKIYLPAESLPRSLPEQVTAAEASAQDREELLPYLAGFAACFGEDLSRLAGRPFCLLRPNACNPYKRLYVAN